MPHRVRYLFLLILAVASITLASSAAWQAHAEEKPGHVGYDKGLYIKTDDDKFKVGLGFLIQPQYQYLSMEGQDEVSTVQIRRGRFIFSGNAFTQDLTFKLEYEAVGGMTNTTGEGAVRADSLLDAYLNYKVRSEVQVLLGQFKPFHTREQLTSDSKLQLVDRSLSDEVFGITRSLGLALYGNLVGEAIEYALYVVNDGGVRNTTNLDNEMLIGIRGAYNVLGKHGYTQSDTKQSEDHVLTFGLAANWNPNTRTTTNDILGASADVAYRYKGFSTIVEGNYARELTADRTVWGAVAQLGYFIVPKRFEIAARAVAIVADGNATNGYETSTGLNYFFFDHNVKLASDYAILFNSPLIYADNGAGTATAGNFITTGGNLGFNANQNDHRFRTQLQLLF